MTLFSLLYQGEVKKPAGEKILKAEEYTTLMSIDELLEAAKEDAKRLIEETKTLCETEKQKAIEAGKQEGLALFNQQFALFDQKMKEVEHQMQKKILPIALQAAKKIVGTQLTLHPETIVEIVLQALKPVRQNHEIKIFVSKEDKEALEKEKEKLKDLFDHLRMLSIEEREDLTKGSCIIETEAGIINASLDNQWRALEAAFESFGKRT